MGSMKTVPARGAADPARDAANKEPPTVLLGAWDLRINGPKTVINVPSCIYLGHEVDGDGKQHTEKRLQGIQNMQRPYDRQQVKAFMGGVNYLREHLGIDFAEITVPINNLLKKNVNFEWTDECQGDDDETTSEHIGCATEFTQVHSRTDPMGRIDSSVSTKEGGRSGC